MSLLDFSLCPVAIAARIQRFMSLSSQDSRLSSRLFPRPTSDAFRERCYPPTTKCTRQNSLFLHSAVISLCHFTQVLASTLHPTAETRKAAEICLWHWEGGLLTLLPSVRALVPDFWQLDVFSGLTEASFRTGPPSDKIISPARIFFHVPNAAKVGASTSPQPRRALSSQSKVKAMFRHGKRAVTLLQRPA